LLQDGHKVIVWCIVVLLVGAALQSAWATDHASVTRPSLPHMNLAPAPEFPVDAEWVNTDQPLSLRQLRGKVVLLDFWTYGCINCLHILPDLKRLEAAFAREIVVIGIHTAKYDHERARAHIQQAIHRHGITHPVMNDRDHRVWHAYRVSGWPTQILIDPAGRVIQGFVGEHHRERIAHLIRETITHHRQQGTLRAAPLASFAMPAAPRDTSLSYPSKVAVDTTTSRLVVADTNHHRLVLANLAGDVLAIIGSGRAGMVDGAFATAAFRQPQGMALQGDELYLADTGNHVVRRVDFSQGLVETVLGSGQQARTLNVPGYGRAVLLNSPWALYRHGRVLYIAMAGSHQIWHADLTTGYAEPFAGTGQEGWVDDVHSDAAFGQPSGLAGDSKRLYVADPEVNALRVLSLEPDGTTTTAAGGGLFAFGDRDGPGRSVKLQHPQGVAASRGRIFIADTYNHKIKQFDPASGQVHTLAGTGAAGYRDGALDQARFYEPGGLSASDGKLYVADTNNHRVRVIDLVTGLVSTFAFKGLASPSAPDASASSVGDDLVETMRLDRHVLPALSSTVAHIHLHPPEGWKVNASAPGQLAVTIDGDAVGMAAAHSARTIRPMPAQVAMPFNVAQAGTSALVRVDLAFVVCRSGDESVCVPRQVAWEIPVQSAKQAARADLLLHDRMTSLLHHFSE
jgi:DNA-binding beta-propeller fold protein YncE